eukprot:CAMPEP_0118852146 /NCGR_PEP_ID=MMETSP1163-20130328/1288_1 /TAXON_ID=124430 /ORGANISM="Phaeomonas parva, Strain CCMP2877" /LENGTH=127 /DNA_ID=CAMNT_0006784553 /DNA_START=250 /DNA_END=630 /DNA_ORIENTATION=-
MGSPSSPSSSSSSSSFLTALRRLWPSGGKMMLDLLLRIARGFSMNPRLLLALLLLWPPNIERFFWPSLASPTSSPVAPLDPFGLVDPAVSPPLGFASPLSALPLSAAATGGAPPCSKFDVSTLACLP